MLTDLAALTPPLLVAGRVPHRCRSVHTARDAAWQEYRRRRRCRFAVRFISVAGRGMSRGNVRPPRSSRENARKSDPGPDH